MTASKGKFSAVSSSGVLFLAAMVILAAASLVSLPAIVIDILILGYLFFAIILIVAAVITRDPADVAHLPLLLIFVTILHLGASAAATKAILVKGDAGSMISAAGEKIFLGDYAILVVVFFTFLMCIIVCRLSVVIGRKAVDFISTTIPLKKANLDSQFKAGTINSDQMERFTIRLRRQAAFFSKIAAASKLLFFDAMVSFVIVLVCVFGSAVLGVMNAFNADMNPRKAIMTMGVAIYIFVPAMLVAVASKLLMSKRFFAAAGVYQPVYETPLAEAVPAQSSNEKSDENIGQLPVEQSYIDTQPQIEKSATEIKDDEGCYAAIAGLVKNMPSAVLLLAGKNAVQLPVTAAVNIGMNLIGDGKKCLLIDADTSRDALAAVFDIDSEKMQGKAVPTLVENLWVCPADASDNTGVKKLPKRIASAAKRFEYTIIYAPTALLLSKSQPLNDIAETIVFFGATNDPELVSLAEALKALGSKVHFAAAMTAEK